MNNFYNYLVTTLFIGFTNTLWLFFSFIYFKQLMHDWKFAFITSCIGNFIGIWHYIERKTLLDL